VIADAPPVREEALDELAEAFGLSADERELLLQLAAAELDPGIGPVRAVDALAAIAPAGPLLRWALVELDRRLPLHAAPLRIAPRALHHLLGLPGVDPGLQPVLRACAPGPLVSDDHERLAERIAAGWDGRAAIQLLGDDPDGSEDVATLTAAHMGWSLAAVRARDLPLTPGDRHAFATAWTRESLLERAALLIDAAGGGADAVAPLVDALSVPVFVAAPEPVALRSPAHTHAVRRPGERERRRLWGLARGGAAPAELDALARRPVSARAISSGADAGRAPLPGRLVRRVDPVATWDDLVVPDAVGAVLRDIAGQVHHRSTVYEDWGFAARGSRGLGITALFTGESGTGKTMAAEVLAADLGLDLHVIDLSAVVSKYIGETEKHLAQVFDTAEDGALLLFDEADALFGKRTEVRDSHDRHANVEISYLLQRMEAHRGLAILTTNLKSALDRAFSRRLRFVVAFPFPDAEHRERIWRGAFPPATPLGRLDYKRLAALSLAGGSIRTVAVNAAFLAAAAGERVKTTHVLRAARAEYGKLDRPLVAEAP
jgi:hypothetical protein